MFCLDIAARDARIADSELEAGGSGLEKGKVSNDALLCHTSRKRRQGENII